MQSAEAPQQDLLLVGGGHAHALALRMLAMQPLAGLRITLVSPAAFTPYSGMLPGLLAGHYRFEDTHIDLARFCQWAGVRFLADEVVSLDPQARRLGCRHRGELGYDLLSLDIGSQPELDSVPGAREHALPVKPVAGLWQRWQELLQGGPPGRIAVVGGGAGSVEIALAVAHRLRRQRPALDLYSAAPRVLPGYGEGARRRVEAALAAYGVRRHCDARVERVEPRRLRLADGREAPFDTLLWCTAAAAAPWIAASGLPVDERGFMAVEDTLQSTAFPNVFGAGDIATQRNHPRPKAGVYAVRQAPVLAHNLAAAVSGGELRAHRPQDRFLSLLSLGERSAVAERGGLSAGGGWVWQWKNFIDRRFMRRFSELVPRQMDAAPRRAAAQAPCGGCGAKVDAGGLRAVLAALRERYPEHAPGAGDTPLDDAARIVVQRPLLQTTDQLRALVDDPWLMGRIAAQHALSDIYACAARPHSALAQVTLPFAAPRLARRDLAAVLDGALSVFADCDCRLLGGHSMQGPELQLGFTVNGVVDADTPLGKQGARAGDALLLSKPLGTGALFAAHMQLRADGRQIEGALELMQQSNAAAARIARHYAARALTDVTGFGLAGHLLEMLGDGLSARLSVDALPALPGAVEVMGAGIFSTLHGDNRDAVADRLLLPPGTPLRAQLLFDPQTSGGLLMALPRERAEAALEALHAAGCPAALIGHVGPQRDDPRQTLQLRWREAAALPGPVHGA